MSNIFAADPTQASERLLSGQSEPSSGVIVSYHPAFRELFLWKWNKWIYNAQCLLVRRALPLLLFSKHERTPWIDYLVFNSDLKLCLLSSFWLWNMLDGAQTVNYFSSVPPAWTLVIGVWLSASRCDTPVILCPCVMTAVGRWHFWGWSNSPVL